MSPLRVLLGLPFLLSSCAPTCGPVSDHCDGTRFFGPGPEPARGGRFFSFLRWRLFGVRRPWPPAGPGRPDDAPFGPVRAGTAELTFVNHNTWLVRSGGAAFLVDPIYSDRASPVGWAGPARNRGPGVSFGALPKADAVLVTHNHYDHLDRDTLERLASAGAARFVVPLGDRRHLGPGARARAEEADWWQTREIAGASVTFVPARHWSARGLFDKNRSLWGGFVVKTGGVAVYVAGDTAYGGHFGDIVRRLGPFDACVLPIGAYEPRWFMAGSHMNPDESVAAHLELGCRVSFASHFGTFELSDEGFDAPARDLTTALAARGVGSESFVTSREGTRYVIGGE